MFSWPLPTSASSPGATNGKAANLCAYASLSRMLHQALSFQKPLQNVPWRLSLGVSDSLSNPSMFWGPVSILVVGLLGEYAGTPPHQQLHPGLRVQTPLRHGEFADTKQLCREGLHGELNEQTKSTKFDSSKFYAFECSSLLREGEDSSIAL
jgi:hypothetical protein